MLCLCLISDANDGDDGAKDDDESKQEIILPSISIRHRKWKGSRSEGLVLLNRSSSSSTIPATMNKLNCVLRISFRWRGYKDSRIVIKVVKESEVLFEIEDWIYHPTPPSFSDHHHHHEEDDEEEDLYMHVDRCYDCNHDYIKDLKEGCHFELHYAVVGDINGDDRYKIEILDFNLSMQGKLTDYWGH
jgi:hypothetical protein